MSVYFKAYYVGQGSMNIVWGEDDNGNITSAALFDAGSDFDPFACSNIDSNCAEVVGIFNAANEINIFITHMDSDHYNLIKNIIPFLDLSAQKNLDIFIGSIYKKFRTAEEIMNEINPNKFKFIRVNIISYGSLQRINGANNYFEIICPICNLFPSKCDINDNCAIYIVRDHSTKTALVFTGDITGKTIIAMSVYDSGIKQLLEGFSVYITIPHHGSITSLQKWNLVTIDTYEPIALDVEPDMYYFTHNFTKFGFFSEDLDNRFTVSIVSAGLADGYRHPSLAVIDVFEKFSVDKAVPDSKYIPTYRIDYDGQIEFRGWRLISTSEKSVYSTIYVDGNSTTPGIYNFYQKREQFILKFQQTIKIYDYELELGKTLIRIPR